MTSKTRNKFSPEIRTRAVRMVLDHCHGVRLGPLSASAIGCQSPRKRVLIPCRNTWIKPASTRHSGGHSSAISDTWEKAKLAHTPHHISSFTHLPLVITNKQHPQHPRC